MAFSSPMMSDASKDPTRQNDDFNSLEKGSSETEPLYSDPQQPQPAPAPDRPGLLSRVKRPWLVFSVVALVWIVYSCGGRTSGTPYHGWRWAGEIDEYVAAEQGDTNECVGSANWTTYYDPPPWTPEYSYGAETTLSLPADSNALYLISRGSFQHGTVNIDQSSEISDTVDVRIRVAYQSDKALEHAKVCQMEKDDNEYGVGIFTHPITHHSPHHPHHPPAPRFSSNHPLKFDITLTLPAADGAPFPVKKLVTKMPSYSQHVADLQNSVLFDTISLASVNGPLSVQSVACGSGRFITVNGEINGHFTAQSALNLSTVNGNITSKTNLLHTESSGPSKLTMYTVHGQIDAQVSLTSEESLGGEFDVAARSINGKVGLNFPRTPVGSVLSCLVETTVGGIQVELDSAFEGSYSLQSILGKKLVSQRNVEDPAGKARERVVSRAETFGQVKGDVKWVETDGSTSENEGSVTLKALTGSIELVV